MLYDLLAIASYVLLALGMYTMAKRRGINKPWLAWIPVANMWLLGCISDQYRQVAKGQVKNKRKLLLTLMIVVVALALVVAILAVGWVTGLVLSSNISVSMDTLAELSGMSDLELGEYLEELIEDIAEGGYPDVTKYVEGSLGLLFVLSGLALILSGLSIWLAVVQFMAYYDLFAAAEPKNATVYFAIGLVLSLLGFGVAMSLLVFICKDKDLGLPPRGTVYQTPAQ